MGGRWKNHQLAQEVLGQKVYGRFSAEGELIAFLIYTENNNNCDVLLLATQPQWQKQGHMQALLNDFTSRSTATAFFVEVHEKNIGAIQLYKQLGFRQKGQRKDFYGAGESAYLLAKGI